MVCFPFAYWEHGLKPKMYLAYHRVWDPLWCQMVQVIGEWTLRTGSSIKVVAEGKSVG